jgi:hypothetical protein
MAMDTIAWELAEALPQIEKSIDARTRALLRSARYVQLHAPTKLGPSGPCWFEQAPVVSRLVTLWGHLVESQVC